MGTTTTVPGTPEIPLSADVRAAYQAVYDKNKAAIEGTADFDLLTALDASQDQIGGLLSADDAYRINQDTAQFEALTKAINTTNASLTALQTKIAGVAAGISKFSEVAGAITKVLAMV